MSEAFHPGEYIQEEITARGWTEADLATALGVVPGDVHRLIAGEIPVTVRLAERLAAAFDTTPQVWLNLQRAYRRTRDD